MPASVQAWVSLIEALVLVVALELGIIFTVAWLLTRLGRFIRLHLRRSRLACMVASRLHDVLSRWWHGHQASLGQSWEVVSLLYMEPIFFGIALVAAYNRFSAISDLHAANPSLGWSGALNADSEQHMTFYALFVAVFLLWALGRIYLRRQEIRDQKATRKSFADITKTLEGINKNLDANTRVLAAIAKKLDVTVEDSKSVDGQKDKTDSDHVFIG